MQQQRNFKIKFLILNKFLIIFRYYLLQKKFFNKIMTVSNSALYNNYCKNLPLS